MCFKQCDFCLLFIQTITAIAWIQWKTTLSNDVNKSTKSPMTECSNLYKIFILFLVASPINIRLHMAVHIIRVNVLCVHVRRSLNVVKKSMYGWPHILQIFMKSVPNITKKRSETSTIFFVHLKFVGNATWTKKKVSFSLYYVLHASIHCIPWQQFICTVS